MPIYTISNTSIIYCEQIVTKYILQMVVLIFNIIDIDCEKSKKHSFMLIYGIYP